MSDYQCYFLDGQNKGEVRAFPTPLCDGGKVSPVELEIQSLGGRRPPGQHPTVPEYNTLAVHHQGETYFLGTQSDRIESQQIALQEAIEAGLQPHG